MAIILIVEDDSILADIALQTLSAAGHFVDVVDNGNEAMSAIVSTEADLVILDYGLPGKSGMQILRDIRALPHSGGLAVMMTTARTGDILMRRAAHAGADDYMTKPFDPQELLRRAEALLVGTRIIRSVFDPLVDRV